MGPQPEVYEPQSPVEEIDGTTTAKDQQKEDEDDVSEEVEDEEEAVKDKSVRKRKVRMLGPFSVPVIFHYFPTLSNPNSSLA